MMRLDESSLETAEPYHIPGYCGYCPQFKYKINGTFGKTTHNLLSADGISRSQESVLAPLDGSRVELKEEQRRKLMETRAKNGSDQKYGMKMVPGYTGYVPKGQHYFGDRYALFSRNAITHMVCDQQKYNEQQMKLRSKSNPNIQEKMQPISKRTRMYFPKGLRHSLSPYTLANDDPSKYMMSGYTGFVSKSREIIGTGYPKVTNKALCDFTNTSSDLKAVERQPITLERPIPVYEDLKPLYYKDSGMVPHYTGHVPGEKFRYGRTFGHSTTDAVQKTI